MEVFARPGRTLGFELFRSLHARARREARRGFLRPGGRSCNELRVLQPCLLGGASLPGCRAGFSLGIFSALVAAGSLTFRPGLAGSGGGGKDVRRGLKNRGAMRGDRLSEGECWTFAGKSLRVPGGPSTRPGRCDLRREERAGTAVGSAVARSLAVKRLPVGWAIFTPSWRGFPLLPSSSGIGARLPESSRLELLRRIFQTARRGPGRAERQFSRPNHWYKVLLRWPMKGSTRTSRSGRGRALLKWFDG